jgi:HSP20 family protein
MRVLRPISTDMSWSRRPMTSTLGSTSMDVFENFDQIVDAFFRPALSATSQFQPSCDISETKDHYLVSFDMPGVKKENISIQVEGNDLVLAGERTRFVRNDEVESSVRTERRYGKFERSFKLPPTVDTSRIEADYEDGVLHIALPKAETAKARSIEVQSSRGGLLSKLLGSREESVKDVKVN